MTSPSQHDYYPKTGLGTLSSRSTAPVGHEEHLQQMIPPPTPYGPGSFASLPINTGLQGLGSRPRLTLPHVALAGVAPGNANSNEVSMNAGNTGSRSNHFYVNPGPQDLRRSSMSAGVETPPGAGNANTAGVSVHNGNLSAGNLGGPLLTPKARPLSHLAAVSPMSNHTPPIPLNPVGPSMPPGTPTQQHQQQNLQKYQRQQVSPLSPSPPLPRPPLPSQPVLGVPPPKPGASPKSKGASSLSVGATTPQPEYHMITDSHTTTLQSLREDAAQFSDFMDFIQRTLDTCWEDLMVVGFVVFVDFWRRFVRFNTSFARQFLNDFSNIFYLTRASLIEDMKVVSSGPFFELPASLKIWTKRVTVTVLPLTYRLLFLFFADISKSSLLQSILTHVNFRIVDTSHEKKLLLDPRDEGSNSSDNDDDTETGYPRNIEQLASYRRFEKNDPKQEYDNPQHSQGVLRDLPRAVSNLSVTGAPKQAHQVLPPLHWGLLSGSFNSVERLSDAVPIPWYLQNSKTPLACINGEVTEPTDPNLSLPLCSDTPWAINRWGERNCFYAKFTAHPCTANLSVGTGTFPAFPSIVCYRLNCPTPELSTVRVAGWSAGQWLATGAENGAIALWDVPALLYKSRKREKEFCEVLNICQLLGNDEKPIAAHWKPSLSSQGTKSTAVHSTEHNGTVDFDCISSKDPVTHNLHSARLKATPQLLVGHEASITNLSFVTPPVPPSVSCTTLSSLSIPEEGCLLKREDSSGQSFREQLCLSASADGTARLWNLTTASALAVYEAHQAPIWAIDSAPLGNFFACGAADALASVWTFCRRQPLRLLGGHRANVEAIQCSPNGLLIGTGSLDATAKIWDIRNAKEVRHLESHTTGIDRVAFSPNGRLLAVSGSDNKGVVVWDIVQARVLFEVKFPIGVGVVTCLAFSRGSHTLALGCSEGALILVDLYDPAIFSPSTSTRDHFAPYRLLPLSSCYPCDLQFSPENLLIVCTLPLARHESLSRFEVMP